VFTYRTDEDYERDYEDLEFGGADYKPKFYESYWVYKKSVSSEEPEDWEEVAIYETYPWPGWKYYEEDDFHYKLDSESNIEHSIGGSGTATTKARADRVNSGNGFTGGKFNEYKG